MRQKLRTAFSHSVLPKLKNWLFSLFVVNATSYIFSAPILLWWGMPLSGLSLIGNIVFAPVLALFIILCTTLMTSSLLGLSCAYLKVPLDTTISWWFALLNLGSKRFLYGQIAHPVLVMLAVLLVCWTGFQMLHSTTRKTLIKNLALGCTGITLLFALPLKMPESVLTNKNGKLIITQPSSSAVIIEDHGFFKGLRNPSKAVAFDIKRPIIQTHGTLHVTKLSTTVISSRTFESVAELIIAMDIEAIELPVIQPPQQPGVWRALARIRALAKKHAIKIKYPSSTIQPSHLRRCGGQEELQRTNARKPT